MMYIKGSFLNKIERTIKDSSFYLSAIGKEKFDHSYINISWTYNTVSKLTSLYLITTFVFGSFLPNSGSKVVMMFSKINNNEKSYETILKIIYSVTEVLSTIATCYFCLFSRHLNSKIHYIGFNRLYLAFVILLIPIIKCPTNFVDKLTFKEIKFWTASDNPTNCGVFILADALNHVLCINKLIFLTPIWEEVRFRGLILPVLYNHTIKSLAVSISAILFSLAHLNIYHFRTIFDLGILMGLAYTQSHNILIPILIHSLWNTATIIQIPDVYF